jgi:hypothetical protein
LRGPRVRSCVRVDCSRQPRSPSSHRAPPSAPHNTQLLPDADFSPARRPP